MTDTVSTENGALNTENGALNTENGALTMDFKLGTITGVVKTDLSCFTISTDGLTGLGIVCGSYFNQKEIDFIKNHISEINKFLRNPIMDSHVERTYNQNTNDLYYKMGYRDPKYVPYAIENKNDELFVIYENGENVSINSINEHKYVMYGLRRIVNTLMLIESITTDDTYEIKYPICQDFILLYLLKELKRKL
jgi:hypothetical protein